MKGHKKGSKTRRGHRIVDISATDVSQKEQRGSRPRRKTKKLDEWIAGQVTAARQWAREDVIEAGVEELKKS